MRSWKIENSATEKRKRRTEERIRSSGKSEARIGNVAMVAGCRVSPSSPLCGNVKIRLYFYEFIFWRSVIKYSILYYHLQLLSVPSIRILECNHSRLICIEIFAIIFAYLPCGNCFMEIFKMKFSSTVI